MNRALELAAKLAESNVFPAPSLICPAIGIKIHQFYQWQKDYPLFRDAYREVLFYVEDRLTQIALQTGLTAKGFNDRRMLLKRIAPERWSEDVTATEPDEKKEIERLSDKMKDYIDIQPIPPNDKKP